MPILIKKLDTKFGGNHPNGINPGYRKQSNVIPDKPVIGEPFFFGSLRTTPVVAIILISDQMYIFETRNSVYEVYLNQ